MRITLVEDDHLQVELMVRSLRQALGSEVEIEVVRTEEAFRDGFITMQSNPPELFIIDIMLRWTDPQVNMTILPAEFSWKDAEPPGFRCQELLASNSTTRDIPVVLYSAFHDSNWKLKVRRSLPPTVVYVPKDDLKLVLDAIRKLTGWS